MQCTNETIYKENVLKILHIIKDLSIKLYHVILNNKKKFSISNINNK
jgi:predicted transcriptional regulator